MFSELIPHFPPPFQSQNSRAIDSSKHDICAVATGNCVHFSYLTDNRLNQSYSYVIGKRAITALRFHDKDRQLAVGNVKGSVYLFDIDSRQVIGYTGTPLEFGEIYDLQWNGDILLVLHSQQRITAISYSAITTNHLTQLWRLNLPSEYTKMRVDPHDRNLLLVTGFESDFSIYKMSAQGNEPTPIHKQVSLTGAGEVMDAQWSLHLPSYIFIIFPREIYLFKLYSQSLSSVARRQKSSSPFTTMIQFPYDHSKVFLSHKSGTLTIINIEDPYKFIQASELQHKQNYQNLINISLCRTSDNYLIFWYNPLGIALFDIKLNKMVSVVPINTYKIISIDSDGTLFAFGTSTGCVIYGTLYDKDMTQIYRVSTQPIKFVSLSPTLNQIIWNSNEAYGIIDLTNRKINSLFTRRSPIKKAKGSFLGQILVQREDMILGLDSTGSVESPISLPHNIIDFCFNSLDFDRCAVLLENNAIYLYKNCHRNVLSMYKKINKISFNGEPTCIAWSGDRILIGLSTGHVSEIIILNKKQRNYQITNSPIKKIRLYEGRYVFGLTEKGQLFCELTNTKLSSYLYQDFCVIDSKHVIAMNIEGYVSILQIDSFQQISKTSKYSPLPSAKSVLTKFLNEARLSTFLSEEAKDVYLCYENKPTLKMMSMAAIGESKLVDQINCYILNRASLSDTEKREALFEAYLFADRFSEASDALSTIQIKEDNYLYSVVLAALTLEFENEVSEKQAARLKVAAVSLFNNEKYQEGSILLRLARLDRIAVDYLLEFNQLEEAIKFLRGNVDDNGKKFTMLKIGGMLMQNGKMKESIIFFAGADEFHPLLFAMFSIGEIIDCFKLKKYAESIGKLVPLSSNISSLVGNLIDLPELCQIIDDEFRSILDKHQIPRSTYFIE